MTRIHIDRNAPAADILADIKRAAKRDGMGYAEARFFGHSISAKLTANGGACMFFWYADRRAAAWIADFITKIQQEQAARAQNICSDVPRLVKFEQTNDKHPSQAIRAQASDAYGNLVIGYGEDAREALTCALARLVHIDRACDLMAAVSDAAMGQAQPAAHAVTITRTAYGSVNVKGAGFELTVDRQEGESNAQALARHAADYRTKAAMATARAERMQTLADMAAAGRLEQRAERLQAASTQGETHAETLQRVDAQIKQEHAARARCIELQELAAHYSTRAMIELGRLDMWETCQQTRWEALTAQKNAAQYAAKARAILAD